jgi:hypothetical protein
VTSERVKAISPNVRRAASGGTLRAAARKRPARARNLKRPNP